MLRYAQHDRFEFLHAFLRRGLLSVGPPGLYRRPIGPTLGR